MFLSWSEIQNAQKLVGLPKPDWSVIPSLLSSTSNRYVSRLQSLSESTVPSHDWPDTLGDLLYLV